MCMTKAPLREPGNREPVRALLQASCLLGAPSPSPWASHTLVEPTWKNLIHLAEQPWNWPSKQARSKGRVFSVAKI